MNRTEDATADGESSEFNHDRTECEQCGKDIYYEPRIRHGTQYQATSGWCCKTCSWTKIDPESGSTPPWATGSNETMAERDGRMVEGIKPCAECLGTDVEATRRKLPSADSQLDFEILPVIACADCGAVVIKEPAQEVYQAVDR